MSFPHEGDGSLNPLFKSLRLSVFDHGASKPIVSIKSDASVSEALRILMSQNILSAPVRNVKEPEDASWVNKYSGMVDFLGIVDWFIKKCNGRQPASFEELMSLERQFAQTTVGDLTEINRWSPFVPLDYELDSVLDALLLLGKYGLHRVCTIKSPEGVLVSVITQSAVVALLHNNMLSFQDITSKTIKELGLVKHMQIGSIGPEKTYWDAFKLMSDKLYSAVPVLKNGVLVGNVSVKDLRIMFSSPGAFGKLNHPLSSSTDFVPLAYTCEENDTLASVLHKLEHTRVHRVYLVDADNKVIAVISLREIIACLVKEPSDSKLWEYFAI